MTSEIPDLVSRHESWRSGCLNLVASENSTSPQVRELLSSDLGHRYTLPVGDEVHGHYIENAYRGAKYLDLVEEQAEEYARDVFHAGHACLKPLSGHIAGLTILSLLCSKGDTILTISPSDGGYDGYSQRYVPDLLGLDAGHVPLTDPYGTLDVEKAVEKIGERSPSMVVLGASFFLFPYPLEEVAEACRDVGSLLAYDGSHVLGLIAGGRFQPNPLRHVDVLLGSTHKSFFGPQGGLIVTDSDEADAKMDEALWRTWDNAHWHRIAALGQALWEAREFGEEYASTVVRNSKALASALDQEGVPVIHGDLDYTESHQVMLDRSELRSEHGLSFHEFGVRLQENGIIADEVGRIGTSEATRMGLEEEDMEVVASLISRALAGEDVQDEVEQLVSETSMKFC